MFFSKAKDLNQINIFFVEHHIKKHDTENHFGCQLDPKLNGETIDLKVLNKINIKLKLLHRQNRYLTPVFKRILRINTWIKPHFDCMCILRFPLVKRN